MNAAMHYMEQVVWRCRGVLVLLAAVAGSVLAIPMLVPLGDEGLRLAICLCAIAPMIALVYRGSPTAVPYLIAVVVANRGLRRVLDWLAGEFSAVTVLSMLPAMMASVMGLAALARWGAIPKRLRVISLVVMVLLGYGAVMGVGNGIGFVVALSDYTSILAVVLYVGSIRVRPIDIDRWYRAIAVMAAAAVAYGWYQFMVLPGWDASWMEWSKMSSIGDIEPGGFRTFSTMASPGPYSVFLVLALLPPLVNARWRPGGWVLPMFILSGLLLTLVRSAWLMLVVGLLVWAMTGRSREAGRVMLIVGVMVIVGAFLMPYMPGADRISKRLDSLTHIGEDHSANDRTDLLLEGPKMVVTHPLGQGLGSTGTAVRLADASRSNVALDNGVFYYFLTFGALGGIGFTCIAVVLWRNLTGGSLLPPADASPADRMALVGLTALLFGLSAVNVVANASAWMVWPFVSVALCHRMRRARSRRSMRVEDAPLEEPGRSSRGSRSFPAPMDRGHSAGVLT